VFHAIDILQYTGKFTFQDRELNKTSVDKIHELRQVADMAFKSDEHLTEMPGKDTGEDAFTEWTDKIHRALEPILWEVCSDTYTMFKIQHPNYGDGVRDFKWNWVVSYHGCQTRCRRQRIADAKCNTDATQSPPKKKAKKELTKKEKKEKSVSKKSKDTKGV